MYQHTKSHHSSLSIHLNFFQNNNNNIPCFLDTIKIFPLIFPIKKLFISIFIAIFVKYTKKIYSTHAENAYKSHSYRIQMKTQSQKCYTLLLLIKGIGDQNRTIRMRRTRITLTQKKLNESIS